MVRKVIENQQFGGERALYHSRSLHLRSCTFNEGESCIKESADIIVESCIFKGKYAMWHNHNTLIENCTLTEDCRAPIWYDRGITMRNTTSTAPKIFREVTGITLENVVLRNAIETLWRCHDIKASNLEVHDADYLFMMSDNITVKDFFFRGKYAFQYCKNVVIENADIDSKDLFWECDNVIIKNAKITTEYLAWYTKNITFENCHIAGTQPLCYVKGVKLINCTFDEDADLGFENTTDIDADIKGHITSIKNPVTGIIRADSVGEIIRDENIWQPNSCQIITNQ